MNWFGVCFVFFYTVKIGNFEMISVFGALLWSIFLLINCFFSSLNRLSKSIFTSWYSFKIGLDGTAQFEMIVTKENGMCEDRAANEVISILCVTFRYNQRQKIFIHRKRAGRRKKSTTRIESNINFLLSANNLIELVHSHRINFNSPKCGRAWAR